MDNENYEYGQKAQPKFNYHEMVIEKKLDRALRNTEVKKFQEMMEEGQIPNNQDMYLIYENINEDYEIHYTPDLYAYILNLIYEYDGPTKTVTENIRTLRPVIDSLVSYQLGYMHKQNHHISREHCLKGLNNFLKQSVFPDEIAKLLHFGKIFTQLIIQIAELDDLRVKNFEDYIKEAKKINSHYIPDLKIKIVWSRTLFMLISDEDETIYIGPKDMCLLISNKINDLCSVYLYTIYAQKTVFPTNSFRILDEFIRELMSLCLEYKSDFYVIMKSLEALVNAEILIDVEDWDNYEFLISVSQDLKETAKFNYLSSKLRKIIKKASPNYKYELGCLSKIMGHPYVDMEGGALKLFQKATQYFKIDMKMVEKTICYAKENFIKNYYARHKKWPPVVLHKGVSKVLEYSCMKNLDPRSRLVPAQYRIDHTIDHYHFVELQKCEDFKYLEQFIPYLKDRTISLLRQEVEEKFLDEEGLGPWTDWKRCRLLLQYLISPVNELNHVDYIKRFDRSITLEELKDYLTIRIVPKEKELKEKFRGFGCKTYEDRARCLAQEKTAVEFLEKYSEEQAMAVDEISLNKKLRSFRSLFMAFPQHRVVCINIDASGWCGHQRREVVDVLMSELLDPIYGVNIFSKTQLAYQTTLYYIPDGKTTYSKEGIDGAIEGLNQDTWVATYLPSVHASLETIKYKYFALCRGDDLRLVFCIPDKELEFESLLDIKNRILKVLSVNMLSLGHEIKIQDSYGSEKLFTFCKQAALRDLELTQSYRKIQKCHGSNNAFIETLDEYIASSFSNGHSAAKVSTTPLPSYYVACFWALYSLKTSFYFKDCDENQLIALMLIPSLAGGFPIIYLHNFFVRAESDLLTPFIDIYLYIKKINPTVSLYMSRFMKTTPQIPNTFEALYNDPYSIPICRPLLPTGYLRAQMPEALERIAKNETIVELLQEVNSPSQSLAIKALDSCNILHAKPLSVIYQALPKAMLTSILKMFESSKSVLQLLCNQRKKRMHYIINKAFKVECYLQRWRYKVLTENLEISTRSYVHLINKTTNLCPVYIADRIRQYCWGKTVVGVTMPPITHLMTYYSQNTAPINNHVNNNHFLYYIHKTSYKIPKEDSDHFHSGDKIPFVGFKTRPGTQLPEMHFIEKDTFLIHIKNMIELDSWFHVQHINEKGEVIYSNIRELLNKVIKLYTNDTIESLQPFTGFRRSGVVEHHLACQGFNSSIVPNMNVNRYTRMSGTTDTHSVLVHSSDKWKLNILHILCHSVSVLTSSLDVSKKLNIDTDKVIGVTTDCVTCTEKIIEHPIIFNTKTINKMRFRSLQSLRVSKNAIKILKQTTELYESKKFHDLVVTSQISLEAASTGIIMEELSSYNNTILTLQNELDGHVPNPHSIDLLKSLQISKSNKNTSLTEIKAIPIPIFAKVLSHLVTDYILRKYNKVYSIDQLSLLYTGPGHALPWYKILSNIAHTGMNIDILTYLQKITKLSTVIIAVNLSQQAIQLIPLAVTYSLYHDFTPTKFVMITDLIPEVNVISLRSSIKRRIHSLLGSECLKLLDPETSFKRSLLDDCHALLRAQSWDNIPGRSKTRLRAFFNGLYIILTKYNNPLNKYVLKPQSITEIMTLSEIHEKLVDEDDESMEDLDDETDFMLDFEINSFCLTLSQNYSDILYEIEDINEDDDLNNYYTWMNKLSNSFLYHLLAQVILTPLHLFKMLCKISVLPNTRNYEHEEVTIVDYVFTPMREKCDNSSIEIVIAPIVSCGQKLRQVLRQIPNKTSLRQELKHIAHHDLIQTPRHNNLTKWITLDNIQEGNQEYQPDSLFHTRTFTISKRIPLWKYHKRIYGHNTSSYQTFADIAETFNIQHKSIKVVACGVGLGGDIMFIDHYFPNSDVCVITSLQGNYSKKAILPYLKNSGNNINIFDEHLNCGFNDVGESRTFYYIEDEFKDNVHLIWYDIEVLSDVTIEDYDRYLYLITAYFLRNKSTNGYMIIKIDMSAKYTKAVLTFVSLLLHYNSKIHVIRSHTMIPCNYLFMMVINNRPNIALSYDINSRVKPFIAQRTFTMINQLLVSIHYEIDNYENINGYKYSLNEHYTLKFQDYLKDAPLYWRSLLSHNLNIVVTDTALNKVIRVWHSPRARELNPLERHARLIQNFVFKYDPLHNTCLRLLYDYDNSDVLNNQEARITMIRRACMLTGFNDILEFGTKQGYERQLTALNTHKSFIVYFQNTHNSYRDTHLHEDDDWSVLLEQNHSIGDVQTLYHSYYNKGVSMGLSFLGWIRYGEHLFSKNKLFPLYNLQITDDDE